MKTLNICDEMVRKGFFMTLSYIEALLCLTPGQTRDMLSALSLYLREGEAEVSDYLQPLFKLITLNIDAEGNDVQKCEKENEKEKEKEKVTQKEIDKEKDKEKAREKNNSARAKNFIKPTVEEVKKYAESKGYKNFDAEYFCAFYETKGWLVGKTKMRSWRARHPRSVRLRPCRLPPDAISGVFTESAAQPRIVHQIRNSIKYAVSKRQKEHTRDPRAVYGAVSRKDLADNVIFPTFATGK